MIHPFGRFGDTIHESDRGREDRELERTRQGVTASGPSGDRAQRALNFDVGEPGGHRWAGKRWWL
jgi:hypothetical protein